LPVAFYNIWPGNTAGLIFQPRSPRGVKTTKMQMTMTIIWLTLLWPNSR